MRPFASLVCWFAIALFSGCNRLAPDASSIAYVAPATLPLRPDLTQKKTSVAVLQHGERVLVLDVRRRFVKVRTLKGVEGWVDAVQLMTPEKMAQLKRETDVALQMPSEGAAGVYEALNIHIDPARQSPAFARIPEGGSVEVLSHRLSPKLQGAAKASVFPVPRPPLSRKAARKEEFSKSDFPFPKMVPPKAPADADQLEAESEQSPTQPEIPSKPPVLEDWTLVRTREKQVGWVLSRNLVMSIPDEVAQYAEGHRITSYFSLGAVNDDEKGVKKNWLWTTLSGQAPYDFDAWRVFIWNRKRHRYETSHRERDLEGYFPVQVEPAALDSNNYKFSLIVKDETGKLWLRTFRFDGMLVHSDGTTPYTNPPAATPRRSGL